MFRSASAVAVVALSLGAASAVAQDGEPPPATTAPVQDLELPVQELDVPVQELELPVSSLDGNVSASADRVVLQSDVLFAFNKARLSSRAKSRIAAAAEEIRAKDPQSVRIDGFTDAKGSNQFNRRLSLRRARAVQRALRSSLGGDAPSFTARGRGERDPVAANTKPDGSDSRKGRAKNRRVELRYG